MKYFANIRGHIKDVHDKVTEKCDICGIIVAARSIIKHKETHNKVECKDCGLYFTETILRLRHPKRCGKKRENNVSVKSLDNYPRSGKCEICGKCFAKLRQHIMEVHEKVTETCEICGKVVASRSIVRVSTNRISAKIDNLGLMFPIY